MLPLSPRRSCIWKRLLTYESSYLQAFSSQRIMAFPAFIIDYSGGTVGESHPIPFFQTQLVSEYSKYHWGMQESRMSSMHEGIEEYM